MTSSFSYILSCGNLAQQAVLERNYSAEVITERICHMQLIS